MSFKKDPIRFFLFFSGPGQVTPCLRGVWLWSNPLDLQCFGLSVFRASPQCAGVSGTPRVQGVFLFRVLFCELSSGENFGELVRPVCFLGSVAAFWGGTVLHPRDEILVPVDPNGAWNKAKQKIRRVRHDN